MKKFGLAFFVSSFSIWASFSQSTDSIYYVRILDDVTREPLPFVNLIVSEYGITKGGWTSDLDGIVKIMNPKFQISEHTSVKVTYVGYSPREIIGASLTLNDTLEIVMKLQSELFESIEIVSYWVPLIDKDPENLSRKEKKRLAETPFVDSSKVYSPEILATYDSIVNGSWFKYNSGNEVAISHFNKYVYSNIRYPEHARKYGIEETVYFNLTIDTKGYINNISLKRGACPVLVIEVARALKGISRIVFEDWQNMNSATTFTLPIRFILR